MFAANPGKRRKQNTISKAVSGRGRILAASAAEALENRWLLSSTQSQTLADLPLSTQQAVSVAIGRDQSAYRAVASGSQSSSEVTFDNAANGFIAQVGSGAVQLAAGGDSWAMSLTGLGFGSTIQALSTAVPAVRGNRVDLTHTAADKTTVDEWYINGPGGLEQGFDVSPLAKPQQTGTLTLTLALSGDLKATVNAAKDGLTLAGANGSAGLGYTGLTAHDAGGKTLPSWLEVNGAGDEQQLLIHVNDVGAKGRITIDPFVQQIIRPTGYGGEANDGFGISVAVDGTTMVIGAFGANINTVLEGAAYVFTLSNSVWVQTAKLVPNDGANDAYFGNAVAISGTKIVVGAYNSSINGHAGQGAAYVFTESGSTWLQSAKLTAADGAAGDALGLSVGISGNNVLVSAPFATINGNQHEGAAYLFQSSGGVWSLVNKLTGADTVNGDFGRGVAISGTTAIVGEPGDDEGKVFVFSQQNGVFQQLGMLVAFDGPGVGDFGFALAISGDTAVIGAPLSTVGSNSNQGKAYVFTNSGSIWTQAATLTASDGTAGNDFGIGVSVSGTTAAVGSLGARAAYVFSKTGTAYGQSAELTSADGAAGDAFGNAVGLGGANLIVGAYDASVVGNAQQGSAYAFAQSGSNWSASAKIVPTNGNAIGSFGYDIAATADTLFVGAPYTSIGTATLAGAVYVFSRSGSYWVLNAILHASDASVNAAFGLAVAASGSLLIVGAPDSTVAGHQDQGAAYVFSGVNNAWSQISKLTASDGAAGDAFGQSVAISGMTAVIGAPNKTVGGSTARGEAYVFTGTNSSWSQFARLNDNAVSAGSDYFGTSVAVEGNQAFVTAPSAFVGTPDQGAVFVFTESNAVWSQTATLAASDGAVDDGLGYRIAVSGNLLVVSTDHHTILGQTQQQGAAYVFSKLGSSWSQVAKLTSSDGTNGDIFGLSVAISGGVIAVGAFYQGFGSTTYPGRAYVFSERNASWTQTNELVAPDGVAEDGFGFSAAFAGNQLMVSATQKDEHAFSDGEVYPFNGLNQLAFSQQPSLGRTNVALPSVSVNVNDITGSLVTGDTSSVTLAIASGPAGATLGGTVTVPVVNGVATFSNLLLTTPGPYTLVATDGDYASDTSITFNVALPNKLAFAVPPVTTRTNATLPPVQVNITDAGGNLLTGDDSAVTLALAPGSPAGATLGGTVTVNAVNGVATFGNLTLSTPGSYALIAASGSYTAATSGSFVISLPNKLVFGTPPAASRTNATLPTITVNVLDGNGNVLTGDTSSVTIAIASGPAGTAIGGTITVAAVNGVATFSNLSITTPGTYTLSAADGSYTPVTSASFTVALTNKLAFAVPPVSGRTNAALPTITVNVLDGNGNLLTGDNSAVALVLAPGGPAGATLGGTVTVNAVNGVATFNNLTLATPGTYTLIATDGSDTSVTSALFTITLADISLLVEHGNGNTKAADLTLSGVKFTALATVGGSVVGGTTISGTLALNNKGKQTTAGSTVVEFFLSTDGTPSTTDTLLATVSEKNLKVNAGKSGSVTFKLKIPANVTGSRQVVAFVNPVGTLAERTTLNNALSLKTIRVAAPFVNLTAGTIKPAGTATPGKTLPVNVSIKNTSNQPFSGTVPVSVGFVDSSTGATTALGTFQEKLKLAIGVAGTFSLKVPISRSLAGRSGKLFFDIDPHSTLGESKTTDNTTSVKLNVSAK